MPSSREKIRDLRGTMKNRIDKLICDTCGEGITIGGKGCKVKGKYYHYPKCLDIEYGDGIIIANIRYALKVYAMGDEEYALECLRDMTMAYPGSKKEKWDEIMQSLIQAISTKNG